jgi:hypothetical protein
LTQSESAFTQLGFVTSAISIGWNTPETDVGQSDSLRSTPTTALQVANSDRLRQAVRQAPQVTGVGGDSGGPAAGGDDN